ncbi:hypothetical protein Tco_0575196 [Tanacetum coccineum]
MHNNIMAAGSRDRPPMLATGRYAQWRSQFLRYIDTRPNGDTLRKCILKGPYSLTIVTTPVVPTIENSPAVPEQTTVETVMNMTPENKAHFESEKEAIHLILTGIGDEIYSTVDAFNELRAERMAKNANPLALVATAQTLQDPYYQSSKSHKSYAPTSKASLPTRSHATTRYKGKEIAKPITPPSESALKEEAPTTSSAVDNEDGFVAVTSRKKKKKTGPNRVSGVNLSKCNPNLKYRSVSQSRKGNGEASKVDIGPMKGSLQDNGGGNTYVDEVVSIKNSFANLMEELSGLEENHSESLWENFKAGKVASSSKSKITSLDDDSDDEEVYMPDGMTGGGSMYGLEYDLDCYDDYETQVYDLTPQEQAFCDQYDIRLNSRGRK